MAYRIPVPPIPGETEEEYALREIADIQKNLRFYRIAGVVFMVVKVLLIGGILAAYIFGQR